MELSENWVNLIGHLAWPITIIAACSIFYNPLSKLVETLGQRITKLSAFKVKVELGQLSQARSLSATVESLRKVAVTESGLAPIVAGVIKSGAADYLLVDIGKDDDENWLTSRLFLLAAILERGRTARCLVFLDESQRFVGAATTRDVRSSIGAHFLAYEAAFASAYGQLGMANQNIFRSGLNETLVNNLSNNFLRSNLIFHSYDPNPDIGWVKLERTPPSPTTWEFADWVTAGSLRDILGERLLTASVVADVGPATPDTTRFIVRARGAFVALTNKDGAFLHLCDRNAVLETVAREAMEQTADSEEVTPPRKARAGR
jgi:hypothetical protein